MKNTDDYLWDAEGGEERELVQHLEQVMGAAKWSGELPGDGELVRERTSLWQLTSVRWAASLAAAVLVLFAWWPSPWGPGFGEQKRMLMASLDGRNYQLELLSGSLELGGALAGNKTEPRLGESIETGPESSAILHVPGLGTLTLEANTKLAVVDPNEGGTPAGSAAYESPVRSLVTLERGAFEAVINATPGAFQVNTPAGLSVDLGCAYRAEVRDGGHTSIAVTIGRVAFEGAGRRVFVPAGAAISAVPGGAPTTPLMDSATDELRELVALADRDGDLDARQTRDLLAASTPEDAVSLLHLLQLPSAGPSLLEHLAAIESMPGNVSEQQLLGGDDEAMQEWLRRF